MGGLRIRRAGSELGKWTAIICRPLASEKKGQCAFRFFVMALMAQRLYDGFTHGATPGSSFFRPLKGEEARALTDVPAASEKTSFTITRSSPSAADLATALMVTKEATPVWESPPGKLNCPAITRVSPFS